MKDIDVTATAEVIEEMANNMEHYAAELRRHATKMRERNEITYAAEAIATVSNAFHNLRLDLLVVRPIREFQRREVEFLKD